MPESARSSYGEYEGTEAIRRRKARLKEMSRLIASTNIAEDMEAEELNRLGAKVVREFEVDESSRSEWKVNHDEAMKVAKQVLEEKNYPWPRAANIKYPLLVTAAIQFAARAYPATISGRDVVKGQVVGNDSGIEAEAGASEGATPQGMTQEAPQGMPQGVAPPGQQEQPEKQWRVKPGEKRKRADRIGRHMSYQLLNEMVEWEVDTDKLLHIVPIAGCCFRKTYFDPGLGRNRSELVTADRFVVNNNAKSLATVPRATELIDLYPHEIEERIRDGRFLQFDPGQPAGSEANDDSAPHEFLEQHRLEDMDRDGYPEPYIVTVHKETAKVVRIKARYDEDSVFVNEADEVSRIEADQYYTKFPFIPALDGSFYDIGFGELLRSLSKAIDTSINQMLDAGHLQNTGGGFIGSGLRIKGGATRFVPGEYKRVTATGSSIRDNIVPMVFPGPSTGLFSLLGLLIEAGKDITSVKDALTGDAGPANEGAAKRWARIEQGMKVFSAIYKRIFRSLRAEYKKLFKLNSRYLEDEQYFTFLDDPEAIARSDYNTEDMDVMPAADPNMITEVQRAGQAEFLAGFLDDPYFDPLETRKRIVTSVGISDVDQLLVDQPPPNPELAAKADEIDIKKKSLEIEKQKARAESEKAMAQVAEIKSKVILNLAKADAESDKAEILSLKTLLDTILTRGQQEMERGANADRAEIERRRLSSLASPSGNGSGASLSA